MCTNIDSYINEMDSISDPESKLNVPQMDQRMSMSLATLQKIKLGIKMLCLDSLKLNSLLNRVLVL